MPGAQWYAMMDGTINHIETRLIARDMCDTRIGCQCLTVMH